MRSVPETGLRLLPCVSMPNTLKRKLLQVQTNDGRNYREDKVGQAISRLKAEQTGLWHKFSDQLCRDAVV